MTPGFPYPPDKPRDEDAPQPRCGRVIHKYEISVTTITAVAIPRGARILNLDCQGDSVCFWAEVDPDAEQVSRLVTVGVTGGGVPFGDYIGTFQIGGSVGHVYIEPELPNG